MFGNPNLASAVPIRDCEGNIILAASVRIHQYPSTGSRPNFSLVATDLGGHEHTLVDVVINDSNCRRVGAIVHDLKEILQAIDEHMQMMVPEMIDLINLVSGVPGTELFEVNGETIQKYEDRQTLDILELLARGGSVATNLDDIATRIFGDHGQTSWGRQQTLGLMNILLGRGFVYRDIRHNQFIWLITAEGERHLAELVKKSTSSCKTG